jgi:hypothetical protein
LGFTLGLPPGRRHERPWRLEHGALVWPAQVGPRLTLELAAILMGHEHAVLDLGLKDRKAVGCQGSVLSRSLWCRRR